MARRGTATCVVTLFAAACGGRAVHSDAEAHSSGTGGASVAEPRLSGCVASASLGGSAACALRTDGVVFCWGNNGNGQTGHPEETPSPIHRVEGIDAKVIQVQASGQTSFALTDRGEVWAWGSDSFGVLGNGGEGLSSIVPVRTASIPGKVTKLSARSTHACALTDAGSVYCWGNGGWGQLGPREDGLALEDASVPVRMSLPPMAHVVAGGVHTCVADAVSTWCWGTRASGDGAGPTWPVLVNWGGVAVALESNGATGGRVCALSTQGAVVCWDAELPARQPAELLAVAAPVDRIALPETIAEVSVGSMHMCALGRSGTAYCWGSDQDGILGRVIVGEPERPAPVDVLEGPLRHMYAGDGYSCAIDEQAELWCWGSNTFGTIEYIEKSSYKEPPRLEPVRMAIPCP